MVGTTDHLFERMADDLQRAIYIILNMHRVTLVDLTAIRLIEHMSGMMRKRGGELILRSHHAYANLQPAFSAVDQR